MATQSYLSAIDDSCRGNIDFDTDTFYVMLVTSSYAPNDTTHTKRSDVTNEVTGTGYTAGGQACVCTVTKNTGPKTETLSFAATTWAASSITARGAVYYKRRGGASSADELIGYDDFGADFTSAAGNFNVAASVITITKTV